MLRIWCPTEHCALERLASLHGAQPQQHVAGNGLLHDGEDESCEEYHLQALKSDVSSMLRRVQAGTSRERMAAGDIAALRATLSPRLLIAKDLAAAGAPWDIEILSTGLVDVLVRFIGWACSDDGCAAADVKNVNVANSDETERASFVAELVSISSDIVANCSGPMTRNFADMVYVFSPFAVQVPAGVAPGNDCSCGAGEVSVSIRHGEWSGVETAAVVWPCAIVLSSLLVQFFALHQHSKGPGPMPNSTVPTLTGGGATFPLRVCELGCGLGLPSMTLLHMQRHPTGLHPTHVHFVLSDVNEAVLHTVEQNLSLNGIAVGTPLGSGISVQLIPLDASQSVRAGESQSDVVFELIFASDLIYDFTLTPAIVHTLSGMLVRPSTAPSGNPSVEVTDLGTVSARWSVRHVLQLLTCLSDQSTVDRAKEIATATGGAALLCCMRSRDSHDVLAAELHRSGLAIVDECAAAILLQETACALAGTPGGDLGKWRYNAGGRDDLNGRLDDIVLYCVARHLTSP